jgi:hypothetical protein
LTFESGCSQLRADHGDDLGNPEAPEVGVVRWLLANDLVDQLDLLTYPVVVGQGTRLSPDTGPDTALDLVNSRTTSRGITIQTYQPAGRPQYATATAD